LIGDVRDKFYLLPVRREENRAVAHAINP
jgi:hypothetical protein